MNVTLPLHFFALKTGHSSFRMVSRFPEIARGERWSTIKQIAVYLYKKRKDSFGIKLKGDLLDTLYIFRCRRRFRYSTVETETGFTPLISRTLRDLGETIGRRYRRFDVQCGIVYIQRHVSSNGLASCSGVRGASASSFGKAITSSSVC
jgi:hypothetical protein